MFATHRRGQTASNAEHEATLRQTGDDGNDADASTTHRQQAIIVRNVRGRSGRGHRGVRRG
jgi:hypothetical protein